MSSNPYRLDLLFQKYIAGSCTPQELDEFWSLMSELTDEERLSIGIADAWRRKQPEAMVDEEQWNRIYSKLHDKIQQQDKIPTPRPLRYLPYWAAAAIVAFLVWGYFLYPSAIKPEQDKQGLAVEETITPVETDIKVVALPDGTEVTLRKNSRLHYDPSFITGKTRSVHITGEAFFDVAHDAGRPFIVHSGKYSIKVLGTAFNVKTTAGKLAVTVARGRVKVEETATEKPLAELTPGNQLVMDNLPEIETAASVKTNVDAAAVGNWTKQDLVFKNDNWATAAQLMHRKYGVDIRIENPALGHCRFTADFTDKSLNDCLEILCTLTNARWHKSGISTIDIEGGGCK
ncbi:FecR domain-containing protein [Niabella aurantiaca]|uniref:FecR domain-containing protein n=1 Tax=Niabella aurantiaca TaxID=379900 RepID=UPI00035EFC72|nr:FecR domain-containing protein [Niabella aurantiaca]